MSIFQLCSRNFNCRENLILLQDIMLTFNMLLLLFKIKSLDGIQALPQLRELYAQRNEVVSAIMTKNLKIYVTANLHQFMSIMHVYFQIEVIPLTSCFHLQIVNLSSNKIQSLHSTVGVLGQLKRLDVLSLHVSYKI